MFKIDTAAIPTEEPQRREWIKYQLRARGSSLSKVARKHGLSRFSASIALKKQYPRLERAIARDLGLQPKQVWPERYGENGLPARQAGRLKRPVSKDTSRTRQRNADIKGGA